MNNFDKLVIFLNFLYKFRQVKRVANIQEEPSRRENDVEHSYMLTMYIWYICTIYKLDVDLSKVLKYSLVHDLVETYAGDTYAYASKSELDAKKEKEHNAFLKIKSEFADFPEMISLIQEYEDKDINDKEARLVYSLDKTIDPLNAYIQNTIWKEMDLPYNILLDSKRAKIGFEVPAKDIFEETIKRIEEEGILKYFNRLD